jgi:hypothetical protein
MTELHSNLGFDLFQDCIGTIAINNLGTGEVQFVVVKQTSNATLFPANVNWVHTVEPFRCHRGMQQSITFAYGHVDASTRCGRSNGGRKLV